MVYQSLLYVTAANHAVHLVHALNTHYTTQDQEIVWLYLVIIAQCLEYKQLHLGFDFSVTADILLSSIILSYSS